MDYNELADSVLMGSEENLPELISYSPELTFIGMGRSAFVFKVRNEQIALKVFYPNKEYIAIEEATIYKKLQHIEYYPDLYGEGNNFIAIDYIEGLTLFECLEKGVYVSSDKIRTVNKALEMAREMDLTPSDIHLRNIMITTDQKVKVIDVARFRQEKMDKQWEDIQKVYFTWYHKSYFPQKIPHVILNVIANIYKKRFLPKIFTAKEHVKSTN